MVRTGSRVQLSQRAPFHRYGEASMARSGREIITLQCNECKRRNYSTTKNKKTMTEKLELKKFCRHDRKHTVHRETK